MRAKSPRGPAGTVEPRRGVAGVLLVAGLVAALAAAATFAGPVLVDEGLASPVGIAVLGIKGAAWWVTGSVALYSDALESIVNVVAGLVAAA